MMKYLFCILSLAFLFVGVGHIPDKDLQGFQLEAGISPFCASLATFSQAYSASSFALASSDPDHNVLPSSTTFFSDSTNHGAFCLLTVSVLPRANAPVKTLRFNATSVIVRLLSSQDSYLSENRWKNLLADTNYLKYSNRYYIYTLSHILI